MRPARASARFEVLPLMEWIPEVSRKLRAPTHLAPLVDAIERTEREAVTMTGSVSVRHGKTVTIQHGLARRLRKNPRTRVCYATYAAAPALKRSREIRQIYQRNGGKVMEGADRLADWRTTDDGVDDGGLWATSVGGPVTGEGFDLVVVDDAIKSRALAESGLEREKLNDWFRDTLYTRLEPGGSILVIGARWHPDDLVGVLQGEGWPGFNLPALNAAGEALCPWRYDVPALRRIQAKVGEYGWSSLYMGDPFSKGGRLFKDTRFYDLLPRTFETIVAGVDLAYTARSRADYSVAVVLGRADGVWYVLEVIRQQVDAPMFFRSLVELRKRHPFARFTGFFSGTEKGTLSMMRELGIDVEVKPALVDKFSRAQPVAAAWNSGKVLVPREAAWLDDFVTEIAGFTGVKDRRDDQVDALAGAFEDASELTTFDYMRLRKQNEAEFQRMAAAEDDGVRRSDLGPSFVVKKLQFDTRYCRPCNRMVFGTWCQVHGEIPDPNAWMENEP